MKIDIGISDKGRQTLAVGLCTLLADSYALHLKTQGFHWNVTGPMFHNLHLLFGEQHKELAIAINQIAERIRSLGLYAPASFQQFKQLTSIAEEPDKIPAPQMIVQLIEGHGTTIKSIRDILPTANKLHDGSTSDMLTHRLQAHEKAAWMLRSLLEE